MFVISCTYLQREKYQFTGDDTALNSIALICSEPAGTTFGNAITSGQGGWGDWKGRVTCNQYPSTTLFLVTFSLEAEQPVSHGSIYRLDGMIYTGRSVVQCMF